MDYNSWSRHEAVPLSNGIVTRRTGFDYLKPPEEINAYYRQHFGVYWFNELPKTDNVYSPTSQFYGCTLAPGIPLIPNLCRRPLRSPGDGGYDYSTSRKASTAFSDDEEDLNDNDIWTEKNNFINKMLDNGHTDSFLNNSYQTNLNLPLPRRRVEFHDSGLDSDSEFDGQDNHIGHVRSQSRSHNHVTWLSWIITTVTTVVTIVTETLWSSSQENHNHVNTRVPLKQHGGVSWYQYPVLWLYKAALAVHRADVWLLYKVNSLLQVDRWGTSNQRRRWALIILLIPLIIWAGYKLYEWFSDNETSSILEPTVSWILSPFLCIWNYLSTWTYSFWSWFDGSWVSYPWIVLVGWWETSADNTSTDESIVSDEDWSGFLSWLYWPFNSLTALFASLGSYLGSVASTLGEGTVTVYTGVVTFLSAVLFYIIDLVSSVPALLMSVFAFIASPFKSISWPSPTPDYTPSAPPYDYGFPAQSQQYNTPPATVSVDHLLSDQQLQAALVRHVLSSREFERELAERQSTNQAKVDSAISAALNKIDSEVSKVKAELSDKISVEETSVESKMETLKQQIRDLQMALSAHQALGSKLEEKLSSAEHLTPTDDQAIIKLREQIILEVAKVREEINQQVMSLQVNQKVVTETVSGGSSQGVPLSPSAELEAFVNATVERLLAIYDADKIAKVDYALASSGGSVLSVRCTEMFSQKNAQYYLWGYPLWSKAGNDPKVALEPGIVPGQCWAFSGSQGYLVIELSENITVTGFTIEHLPRTLSPSGIIDTAPKDFHVLGLEYEQDEMPILLGRFTYLDNGQSLQHFPALEVDHAFKMVELVIESNHGNVEYTCLYRFRVHGRPVRTPCMYRSFYNS